MLIENKKGTLVKYKIHTLFSISSQNVRVNLRTPNSQFAKIVQTLKHFLLKEIPASEAQPPEVKFMKEVNEGRYIWPDIDDLSVVRENEIKALFRTPNMTKNDRRVEYSFQ